MIPYAELEQAINRWKARKAGTEPERAPLPDVMAGPPPDEQQQSASAEDAPVAQPAQESRASDTGEISLGDGDELVLEEEQQ